MEKPRISFIVALLISIFLGIGAAVNVKIFEEIICTGNIAGATFSGTLTSCTGLPATTGIVPGAANLKLFTNAAASAPEWAAGANVIQTTRNMEAASGDVAVTGVGFKPSVLICYALPDSLNAKSFSVGFASGTTVRSFYDNNLTTAGTYTPVNELIHLMNSTAEFQNAVVKTMDADGFTLTWTKTGTPDAGTAYIYFLCLR